ncbi:MAG: LysR family transcriptional regulator, partial [Burkholderiales bacterium]
AVSRQIIALEERLGMPLFTRRNRSLHLNQAGAAYLSAVQASLYTIRSATASLRTSEGRSGSLAIATLPTFGTKWLAPRVSRFAASYPEISISLVSRAQTFDFDFENLDCAIHFGNADWPGATTDLLCNETVLAVAAPALASRIRTPHDLTKVAAVHISSRAFGWRDWLTAMQFDDILVRPQYIMDSFAMALEVVRAGLAVAILPTLFVDAELREGSLVPVFPRGIESTDAYYFVYPTRSRNQFAVETFGSWLRGEAQQFRAPSMNLPGL